MNPRTVASLFGAILLASGAQAAPAPQDRVYTADQNTNTVSVIDPSTISASLGRALRKLG